MKPGPTLHYFFTVYRTSNKRDETYADRVRSKFSAHAAYRRVSVGIALVALQHVKCISGIVDVIIIGPMMAQATQQLGVGA